MSADPVLSAFDTESIARQPNLARRSHCDTTDACDGAGLALRQNAEAAATGATVSLVAGGVLLAGGAVLWFTAPRAQTARVGLAPSPGGFAVVGGW